MAVGAGKEAHKAKTCKDVYEIYELCDADLRVVYYDIPPYIFTLPNGRVDGIIPGEYLRCFGRNSEILEPCFVVLERINFSLN